MIPGLLDIDKGLDSLRYENRMPRKNPDVTQITIAADFDKSQNSL
jgi:hypothetical protein